MKLQLIKRESPLDRSIAKFYPHVVNDGTVELKDLAKQVTKYSSLSTGDVISVLENMVDAAVLYLLLGKGVRLGRLGMLRVSVQSEGADSPETFNTKMIQRVKLVFTPSVEFKKEMQDISYEVLRNNTQDPG